MKLANKIGDSSVQGGVGWLAAKDGLEGGQERHALLAE